MSVVSSNRGFDALHAARLALVGALVLLVSAGAHAQDSPRVSFAGFGTLGAVYHDESGIEYRRDPSQPRGAQAGKVNVETDSRLGLQLNARLTSQLEAMVQAETKLNIDGDWKPEINWAVLKYSPAQWLSLRAGRLNFDPFVGGDSRDVGYTWLPVRPPIEVFGSMNSQLYDGADVLVRARLGEGLIEMKLFGGEMAGGGSVAAKNYKLSLDGSDLIGGHIEYSTGIWGLRLGASRGSLQSENPSAALISALRELGTRGALDAARAIDVRDRDISGATLSATYQPGPLQVELLLLHTWSQQPALSFGDRAALTVGHRFGEFTPYAVLGANKTKRKLYATGVPDHVSPQIALLNSTSQRIQTASWDNQRSWSLGVRYDPMEKVAIKAQVDAVDVEDPAVLLDTNLFDSNERTFGVFSLSVDFVF